MQAGQPTCVHSHAYEYNYVISCWRAVGRQDCIRCSHAEALCMHACMHACEVIPLSTRHRHLHAGCLHLAEDIAASEAGARAATHQVAPACAAAVEPHGAPMVTSQLTTVGQQIRHAGLCD